MTSLSVSSSFYTNVGISLAPSGNGGGVDVNSSSSSSSSSSSLREDPSNHLSEHHTNSHDEEEIVEASGSVPIRDSMDRGWEAIDFSTLRSSHSSTSISTSTSTRPSIQRIGSDSERTETEDEGDELSDSAASSRGLKRRAEWTHEDAEKICACFNKTEKARWIAVEASKIFPTKSVGQIRSFWRRLSNKIINGTTYLKGERPIPIDMEKLKKYRPTNSTKLKKKKTYVDRYYTRTWQEDQQLVKIFNASEPKERLKLLSDHFPGQKREVLRRYFYKIINPNYGRIDETGRLYPGPYQVGRVEGEFIQLDTRRLSGLSLWRRFLDFKQASASTTATSSLARLNMATTEIDDNLADLPSFVSSSSVNDIAAATTIVSLSSSSPSPLSSLREDSDDNDGDAATSATVAGRKRSYQDSSDSNAKRSKSR